MFGNIESAFDECLVDNHFRCDIPQFISLSDFHLFAHGLEVSLHSVNADRHAVDERERLPVLLAAE